MPKTRPRIRWSSGSKLDVRSRRIVGWTMANHLRTELVLDALDMALVQRRLQSVVHHSNRSCQYTSYAFGKRCHEAGVVPSMGSAGDAYDNAIAESFFATLEREVFNRAPLRELADAAWWHLVKGVRRPNENGRGFRPCRLFVPP